MPVLECHTHFGYRLGNEPELGSSFIRPKTIVASQSPISVPFQLQGQRERRKKKSAARDATGMCWCISVPVPESMSGVMGNNVGCGCLRTSLRETARLQRLIGFTYRNNLHT